MGATTAAKCERCGDALELDRRGKIAQHGIGICLSGLRRRVTRMDELISKQRSRIKEQDATITLRDEQISMQQSSIAALQSRSDAHQAEGEAIVAVCAEAAPEVVKPKRTRKKVESSVVVTRAS